MTVIFKELEKELCYTALHEKQSSIIYLFNSLSVDFLKVFVEKGRKQYRIECGKNFILFTRVPEDEENNYIKFTDSDLLEIISKYI